MKIPVTAAALLKRINRVLKKDGQQLVKNRRWRHTYSLTEWIKIDMGCNRIVDGTNDLAGFARDLGILKEWEAIEEDRRLKLASIMEKAAGNDYLARMNI